ncbi:MAG: hypothetical protein ABIH86_04930 [Planctomycetota bacterium]
MKQCLIAVIVIAFSVSAFGETHVTKAFSLSITGDIYLQDPAMFGALNKPSAGMVVIGNRAYDTLNKGGENESGEPLCWTVVKIIEDVVKFENTPECLKFLDEGARKGFGNTKINNYQSSIINRFNRDCFNTKYVMYDGDLPINFTILSIPTVNGVVTITSISTEKAAGTAFNNLVLSSLTISAPEPKSIVPKSKSIMPNSPIAFSYWLGRSAVGILLPLIIILSIISHFRNKSSAR